MDWYYVENGQQAGPVSDSQVENLLKAGRIAPSTLVWHEGMDGWKPYSESGQAGDQTRCALCGGPFSRDEMILYEGAWVCASCKPVFVQRLKEGLSVSDSMIWRSKRVLIMGRNAALPDRCIKCNAPANGNRLARNLAWHSPFYYALILLNVIIYVIVALFVNIKARIEVGLCEKHLRRRKIAIMIGWMMGLGGMAAFFYGLHRESGVLVAAAVLALLFGIIFGVAMGRVAYARKIDQQYIWLVGVCREYLDTLPEWSDGN